MTRISILTSDEMNDEQRAVIHFALGGAYRRWDSHGEQAAASFEAAWRAAPESVCGRAGMRLFLKSHGGPSLAFGWGDRHTSPVTEDGVECKALFWTIEDFPRTLEPGTYRLRLKRTHGADLPIAHFRLLSDGRGEQEDSLGSSLTKASPVGEIEFTLILGAKTVERCLANWITPPFDAA